jgi:ankyrin repeat protein
MGGDTAMHWLCSFDEDDCDSVADELIRRGADINAQAGTFPIHGRLEYAETEFVAGTPLHRAICRNKLRQVQKLLKLGADIHAPAGGDLDQTPIALAALLHYPHILEECLSSGNGSLSEKLLTPTGKSLLIPAIAGGSINRVSIGRLIRHGVHGVERAIQTLSLLCEAGAFGHLSDLPGMPGCTAIFYASRRQAHIVEWIIQNGARADIDRPSKWPNTEVHEDDEDDMSWPPLFEAILYGKSEVAQKLLDVGADAQVRQNDISPVTALYQCAEASFQDIAIAQELYKRGVRVDDGPPGHETPFQCAVRNGCYILAQFLRDMGANVNALSSSGLMWRSTREQTLLCLLARNNSPSSISGLQFLLDGTSKVDILVEPSLNHTVFHILAMLDGDSQDGLSTTRALDLCKDYFEPTIEDLNIQSFPHEHGDASVESGGGNTALHYAVIHANFPVVEFLLRKCTGMDTSIKNAYGMTALDLAALSYPDFEKGYKPRDVPKSPTRQLKAAMIVRDEIMRLLVENTPSGVTSGVVVSI